jgi:hypothetical protein
MLKVVRVMGDSVTLQWSAPYNDGGSEITRYVVLQKSGGATATVDKWDEAGRVTGSANLSFTVARLREGRPYYFAVYAVNKAGNGDIIETARPITPRKAVSKLAIWKNFAWKNSLEKEKFASRFDVTVW